MCKLIKGGMDNDSFCGTWKKLGASCVEIKGRDSKLLSAFAILTMRQDFVSLRPTITSNDALGFFRGRVELHSIILI